MADDSSQSYVGEDKKQFSCSRAEGDSSNRSGGTPQALHNWVSKGDVRGCTARSEASPNSQHHEQCVAKGTSGAAWAFQGTEQ